MKRDLSQRDVMVISDFPLENEQKRYSPYTESSQITFKDALSTASFKECQNLEEKFLLNSLTVCYTYLSYVRYEQGDYDFATSIVSKKSMSPDKEYVQVPYLKDVYVTLQVYGQLQACIAQIKAVKPKLIVLAGKWSFLFLASFVEEPNTQLATIATTKSKANDKKWFGGLNKFRSSILGLHAALELPSTIVFPILTPAFLFLVKERQFIVNRDYAKIARLHVKLCTGTTVEELLYSRRKQLYDCSKEEILAYLTELHSKLDESSFMVSFDVETRQNAQDCIGIAYEKDRSLTIPFSYLEEKVNLTDDNLFGYHRDAKTKQENLIKIELGAKYTDYRNYWSLDDEVEILHLLWKVMLHPNCKHVGQNYLYDCQWYYHEWKLGINSYCDTMILHHVL